MQRPGNAERWAWLVEHFADLRQSLRSTVGTHEADDVAQETILRASLSTSAVPVGLQGAAWLRRIARNIAIDRWRRDRHLVPLDIAAHVSAEPETTAGRLDVEVALAQLRPSDRRLLALIAGGMRYSELAQAEGVDVSVIRQRAARARARVLSTLQEGT